MPKADFKKLLYKAIEGIDFLKEFNLFPPYCYIKEINEVLRIISFSPGSAGFSCDIAVIPLVAYESNVGLTIGFGVNLSYYAGFGFDRWDYGNTKHETETNLQIMFENLQKKGMAWLDKLGSEEKIINYDTFINDKGWRCPPWSRNMYQGYCALHLGQIKKGEQCFKETISYLESLKNEKNNDRIAKMKHALELAAKGKNEIKEYLDIVVKANREALYVNNLRVMK